MQTYTPMAGGLPAPGMPVPMAGPQNEQMAVWALVLGILSWCCCSCLTGIPAIVLGYMARTKIRESNGALSGDGMALAGIILGGISTAMTVLWFIYSFISAAMSA